MHHANPHPRPPRKAANAPAPAPSFLDFSARTGGEHVAFLRKHLNRARAMLGRAPRELSVALVGDWLMSRLHQQFMGIAGPTDVLSFELETDRSGRVISGEVIICVPEARRQAKHNNIPLRNELLLYALHGLLHLSGFDDRTAAGFHKMHDTEDKLLRRLGVGPVFAAAPHRRNKAGG